MTDVKILIEDLKEVADSCEDNNMMWSCQTVKNAIETIRELSQELSKYNGVKKTCENCEHCPLDDRYECNRCKTDRLEAWQLQGTFVN